MVQVRTGSPLQIKYFSSLTILVNYEKFELFNFYKPLIIKPIRFLEPYRFIKIVRERYFASLFLYFFISFSF
ncbi:MAG: hypothetical protein EAZ20_00960 [Bacteroidetes bacterium]|nr:MAG: hypothetical protein EAZ20_00960 [Bacteroidota bacterium]